MHVQLATKPENEHLSLSEVRTELEKLSEADILRLGATGEQYAWRCSVDGSDLLSEAITKSLSGDRRCPRDISFIAFLVNTMKSIAFNERRKADLIPIQEPIDNDPANDTLFSVPDNKQGVLETVETINELDALYAIFKNDECVTMLLMGLQDGYEPDEICEMEGWDRKKYNSIRKKLRRGVNSNFSEGRQT